MNEAIAPIDVKRTRDVMALAASEWDNKDFWMLVNHDGSVVICRQQVGAEATETIHIPRRVFLSMLKWYQKPQATNGAPQP